MLSFPWTLLLHKQFKFVDLVADSEHTSITKHWRNSHPVVVRDLLENSCSMTWDPIALFSDYLTCISSFENDKEETDDSISMDLFEGKWECMCVRLRLMILAISSMLVLISPLMFFTEYAAAPHTIKMQR